MSLEDFGALILSEAGRAASRNSARETVNLRWATVTSAAPFRVRYDGEDDPATIPPITAGSHSVGDRIVVAKQHEQGIVVFPNSGGGGGQPGRGLEFHWDGTRLGVRVEGDTNYVYTDLKGSPGGDGKNFEFNWAGTQLGVRQQGDPSYSYVDLKGDPGDDGSVWHQISTSSPSAALGRQGDWAIRSSTGEIWEKTGTSSWTPRGVIKGADGTDGAVWHRITTTTPANSLGNIGDWAIRDANGNIWQKTGTSTWTARGSLKGPAGDVSNVAWGDVQGKPATFPPAAHTHDRVETTGTRWVGIAGSNQVSATTYAMAVQSGVSEPSTALSEFPLVVARRDDNNEVRLERLTGTIHADYLPPWVETNLDTYVATSFGTRDLKAWSDGHTSYISGMLGSGSIGQGGVDITRLPLPAIWRPPVGRNWQGAAWFTGGHPGTVFIRPDGTMSAVQRSGGTVAAVQFMITAPRL